MVQRSHHAASALSGVVRAPAPRLGAVRAIRHSMTSLSNSTTTFCKHFVAVRASRSTSSHVLFANMSTDVVHERDDRRRIFCAIETDLNKRGPWM